MDQEQPVDNDLEPFAAALSGLKPRPSSVSHERLMFEVWRSQEALVNRRRLMVWKLATGISTTTAAVFLMLFLRNLAPHMIANHRNPSTSESLNQASSVGNAPERATPSHRDSPTKASMNGLERRHIDLRDHIFTEHFDDVPLSQITGSFNSSNAATYRDYWESAMNSTESGG
ncbi:MAG: hypothetical protein WCH39_10370 [Schlesneria sp.]